MAFGDNNTSNNNNKNYEPNYYGKSYMSNYEDHTSVEFTYGSGLMEVSINRRSEDGKREKLIGAHLTGLKAQLLVTAITKLEDAIENGVTDNAYFGTSVGMGEIVKTIAVGVEKGVKVLIICKVDGSGTISEKNVYRFVNGANYYMTWEKFDTMEYTKKYDDSIEFTMFKNAIIDFSRNISGAAGYGTLYLDRYERSKEHNRISTIMDKLGISIRPANNNYTRNSFFNNDSSSNSSNRGNMNSEHKSFSDIEDMLSSGSEED